MYSLFVEVDEAVLLGYQVPLLVLQAVQLMLQRRDGLGVGPGGLQASGGALHLLALVPQLPQLVSDLLQTVLSGRSRHAQVRDKREYGAKDRR